MARSIVFVLVAMCLISGLTAADWNIINQRQKLSGVQITLKNYCESWRMNVELNNIRDFSVVPAECTSYIGKYMSGSQFTIDSETTIDEITLYLNTHCDLKSDGKDAWIFDVDDTLLSNVAYYKKHGYGGETLNETALEEWMIKGKPTAMEFSLRLFNEIKRKGIQIFLVSSRKEYLRSATIDNLVDAGFYGWKALYLRGAENNCKTVQAYKAGVRQQLINNGYHIWGILADQWSSIRGVPAAKRAFKLPNSLYYVA